MTRFEVKYTIRRKRDEETLFVTGFSKIKNFILRQGKEKVTSSYIRTGEETQSIEFLQIDLGNMVKGPTVLEITVTDLISGKSTRIEKEFLIVD